MVKLNIKYKFINFGAALIAMVVIICISVTITVLTRSLYYFDIENLNIPERSGISAEDCKLNYDALIEYNTLGGSSELIFPTLPMSEQGKIHFQEVREIFLAMQVIAIVGVITLITWIVYIKKKKTKNCDHAEWMHLTGVVTLFVAAMVGISIAVDWQWTFTAMHKIFFDNDYWLFNPNRDPVIKMLPDEFFMHCGIMIVVIVVLQIATLELIYRRWKRK